MDESPEPGNTSEMLGRDRKYHARAEEKGRFGTAEAH